MTGLQEIDVTLGWLLKMRARLSDPNNWCQGAYIMDDKACLLGTALYIKGYEFLSVQAMSEALGMSCGEDVITFNDSHTHAEVLALVDSAIASRVC